MNKIRDFIIIFCFSLLLFCSAANAAIWTVTNCDDNVATAGSLRWAMFNAASGDEIDFNIPTSDPSYEGAGVWRISIHSTLPNISVGNVFVNGSSEAVYIGGDPNPYGPEIMISAEASPIDGIELSSNNNTVEGLVINNFNGGNAIFINGSSNEVCGCYLGTDPTGAYDASNATNNIQIINGNYNLIGGNTPEARNLISGSSSNGILLSQSNSNEVKGNYIGLDRTGNSPIPNNLGIQFMSGGSGCNYNIIGGTTAGEKNIISGNSTGIGIYDSGANKQIIGNYIGTDATGTFGIPNSYGVFIGYGATSNEVGGSSVSKRNIISGNSSIGIWLYGAGTSRNSIEGNYIGLNSSGSSLGNGIGVELNGQASNNIIGGDVNGDRNIISGNSNYGILFDGSSSNEVKRNYIGTDSTGSSARANGYGVWITSGSNYNVIGGETYQGHNLISGNTGTSGSCGILIVNDSDHNLVKYNLIGTDASGTAAIPNLRGVQIGSSYVNEDYNAVEFNLISGNSDRGVYLNYAGGSNEVNSNYIGLSGTGGSLPNNWIGIDVNYAWPVCYLSSNEVQYNSGFGISYNVPGPGACTLNCINNDVKANHNYGFNISGMIPGSQVIFHGGTLEGNADYQVTRYEVYNSYPIIADFQYNDWGSPSGPYDPEDHTADGRWYNPVGLGGQVSDYVDYRNFTGWGTITPEAPTLFNGAPASAHSILWQWQDNTTWESGYQVLDTLGNVKAVARRDVTSTVEAGLTPGTSYVRKVQAFRIDNTSEASATAEATTPLPVGPVITIESPVAGDKWRTEDSHTIEYFASDPDGLDHSSGRLSLSPDSGATWTFNTGFPFSDHFVYTISPGTLTASFEGAHWRMRIMGADTFGNLGTGETAGDFLIDMFPPTMEVVRPASGEHVSGISSTYSIHWLASDNVGLAAHPITIRFSPDNGASWTTVATSQDNTGSYAWTVPAITASSCIISLEAVDLVGRISDESRTFSIDSVRPTVTAVSPTNDAQGVLGTTEVVIDFSETMSREAVQAAFSLTAPAVAGSFAWSNHSTRLTFQPTQHLLRNTTYTITIGTGACDLAGNGLAAAFSSSFSTQLGGPHVALNENGAPLKNGDYIPALPKFNAAVTDSTASLDATTVKMLVDGVQVSPLVTMTSDRDLNAAYQPATPLADETVRTHTLSVEVSDVDLDHGYNEVDTLKVSAASAAPSVTNLLIYPTPFAPSSQGKSYITFQLNKAANIRVEIYDPQGQVVWKEEFPAGGSGGKAGYNSVEFDGRSVISNAVLANGLYLVRIIADGKAAAKSFIVISQ